MIDLMDTYAEAKFGKQAFLGRIFGTEIDPKKRTLRDQIEDLIREEQRKRREARAAIDYGKYRLEEAPKAGKLSWITDIARSLVPGLSISASKATAIVKSSARTPEEGIGGRLFDVGHAGAAGAGAVLGHMAQRGALGDVASAERLVRGLGGKQLTGEIAGALGKQKGTAAALKSISGVDPTLVALAGQKRIPGLTKVVEKLSPTYWARRLGGEPATQAAASKLLAQKLTGEGVAAQAAQKLVEELPRRLSTARGNMLATLARSGKKLPFKGKWGALLGTLIASSPFILARLFKTRQLRAAGGTAGQAAVRKAEELLSGAEQLRKEREALMEQLT